MPGNTPTHDDHVNECDTKPGLPFRSYWTPWLTGITDDEREQLRRELDDDA
ncbi:hypothetical protein [Streptosporangium subroseum]|uniref:hypothetical protein n=1 Tax=Streptosporangium subroseum TaxID=106412 RepID=UPI00308B81A9|nr:hypothetical protein OHB15_24245 [Streptosporangium subroseum]